MPDADRPAPRSAAAAVAQPASQAAQEAATAAATGELAFEEALERLEVIVDRLEGGELALEQALASFEEGVQLSRRLSEQLAAAERRVERLLREGGELLARPFDDVEETE
jgi:exodeoxyribonuclease VII small subunit